MATRATSTTIYDKFYIGVTGLTGGSFTTGLEKDGGASGETVTIIEDAIGWYEVSFTPASTGQYSLKIIYSGIGYVAEYTVAATASSEHQSGSIVYQRFYVGVTGLVSADFTKLLELNNAATGGTLTITEDAGGWYDVSFTPTSNGDWIARIDYVDNHIKIDAFVNIAGSGATVTANLNSSLTPSGLATAIGGTGLGTSISLPGLSSTVGGAGLGTSLGQSSLNSDIL